MGTPSRPAQLRIRIKFPLYRSETLLVSGVEPSLFVLLTLYFTLRVSPPIALLLDFIYTHEIHRLTFFEIAIFIYHSH